MAEKQLKARLALKRDQKNNIDPLLQLLNGEVIFVDDNNKIRVKVGDGQTPFYNLSYLDEKNDIVIWGYYLNGKFYIDSTYTTEVEKSDAHIYLDRIEKKIYIYDGANFICIDDMIPSASQDVAGIMKLYEEQGQNEDGTVTQKFFTDSIDDIIFGIDNSDNECLVLEKPW